VHEKVIKEKKMRSPKLKSTARNKGMAWVNGGDTQLGKQRPKGWQKFSKRLGRGWTTKMGRSNWVRGKYGGKGPYATVQGTLGRQRFAAAHAGHGSAELYFGQAIPTSLYRVCLIESGNNSHEGNEVTRLIAAPR